MKPPPSKKKGGDNPHPKNFKNPPFCWISPNKKLIPPFSHVPCCPSPDHGQHIGKKGNSNSLYAIITHNFTCSWISHKHLSAAESNAPFLGAPGVGYGGQQQLVGGAVYFTSCQHAGIYTSINLYILS